MKQHTASNPGKRDARSLWNEAANLHGQQKMTTRQSNTACSALQGRQMTSSQQPILAGGGSAAAGPGAGRGQARPVSW